MKYFEYILCFFTFICYSQNIPVDSIPFFLESDHRIYTYLTVNDTDSLYFMIDTGASDMIINAHRSSKVKMNFDSKIENIGVTGSNNVLRSSNNSMVWGNHAFRKFPFLSIPYVNEKWDGIIGLSLLELFTFQIDYENKMIYLYDREKYVDFGSSCIEFKYVHQIPVIEVELQTNDKIKHSLKLEIDTGSDGVIYLSSNYVKIKGIKNQFQKSSAKFSITSSDGSIGEMNMVNLAMIVLAEFELYRVPGAIAQENSGILNSPGIDGVIGNLLLKRFNLTFDFSNQLLYLEPNDNMYTPFYNFLTE